MLETRGRFVCFPNLYQYCKPIQSSFGGCLSSHEFSCFTVFDTLKLPKVDGIACPEVDEYNVLIMYNSANCVVQNRDTESCNENVHNFVLLF